ncbi:MAG: hypothetical protein RML47_02155 [Bacteroidota bacterium]|nr:hypothetical protein [Rhodothermia bacterium]MCS7155617.1 hypothetical protein [Bacteroidota bacterium]MDW8137243.1 hypothetical protein [Bacteroidota bacterium]MDW8284887.1 hypothetical protein [Bacteroidota bacterium]
MIRYESQSMGGRIRWPRDASVYGKSQLVNPSGNLLLAVGRRDTGLFRTGIDPMLARDKRITALNDPWANRRPDLYEL